MNIEKRLDLLEKQNRRLRRGLVGLLLLVLVVPLVASTLQQKKLQVPAILRAKKVIAESLLLEKDGIKGAEFWASQQGSYLALYSTVNDKPRKCFSLSTGTGETSIALSHPSHPGCHIGAKVDGIGTAVAVVGPNPGTDRPPVAMLRPGSLALMTSDKSAVLFVNDKHVALLLRDKMGEAILGGVSTTEPGTRKERTFPAPTLTLMDKEGEVLHQVPK